MTIGIVNNGHCIISVEITASGETLGHHIGTWRIHNDIWACRSTNNMPVWRRPCIDRGCGWVLYFNMAHSNRTAEERDIGQCLGSGSKKQIYRRYEVF